MLFCVLAVVCAVALLRPSSRAAGQTTRHRRPSSGVLQGSRPLPARLVAANGTKDDHLLLHHAHPSLTSTAASKGIGITPSPTAEYNPNCCGPERHKYCNHCYGGVPLTRLKKEDAPPPTASEVSPPARVLVRPRRPTPLTITLRLYLSSTRLFSSAALFGTVSRSCVRGGRAVCRPALGWGDCAGVEVGGFSQIKLATGRGEATLKGHPQQRLISPTPHLPPKGGIWACELKKKTGRRRWPPLGGLKMGGLFKALVEGGSEMP